MLKGWDGLEERSLVRVRASEEDVGLKGRGGRV
jgi:hypothetical protein